MLHIPALQLDIIKINYLLLRQDFTASMAYVWEPQCFMKLNGTSYVHQTKRSITLILVGFNVTCKKERLYYYEIFLFRILSSNETSFHNHLSLPPFFWPTFNCFRDKIKMGQSNMTKKTQSIQNVTLLWEQIVILCCHVVNPTGKLEPFTHI